MNLTDETITLEKALKLVKKEITRVLPNSLQFE